MITQVFNNGNDLAVLIPKEFNFTVGEVEIVQINDELIVRPLQKNLAEAFELLASLDSSGFEQVSDALPQNREAMIFG